MIARPSLERISTLLILVLLSMQMISPGVLAQAQEPSPIEIELVAPTQGGPGEIIDISIRYNVVDINAGAVLNYNLAGPGRIWTRAPEPPNPIVNTWGPKFDPIQGTIKIQVRIDEGTDGQAIRHEVQIQWGAKHQIFNAETQVKFVPPTPTPTSTPRPAPRATPTPPVPVQPVLNLTYAALVGEDAEAKPLAEAETNDAIALAVQYTSSGDVQDVTLRVRFEPDVVNLDGLERDAGGYLASIAALPAAAQDRPLPGSPFPGRIRPYAEGGEQYELKALVQLVVPEGSTANVPETIETASIQVTQRSAMSVRASVDGNVVKSGGSVIVHVTCDNTGSVPIRDIRLAVAGLPEGLAVQPEMQVIDQLPAGGGSQERLFTIRTSEGQQGNVAFRVAAVFGESQTIVESAPVSVLIAAPVPLTLQVSADRTAVRAGGSVYYHVLCTNEGQFVAPNVTARLIDTVGTLGVLLQNLGDIAPGETREFVFVVEIPVGFPADVVSSMVVQTISEDGTVSQSSSLPLAVACVPSLELLVQTPANKLEEGQSAQVVTVIRNTSQCAAREIAVSIGGLPQAFAAPPEQRIVELGPGETRRMIFNLLIPDGQPQGDVSVTAAASDSLGATTTSAPAILTIGGVSTLLAAVLGVLALLAIAIVVFGLSAYFRHR